MANYFTDNEDLQYYFSKGLDWKTLIKVLEDDYQQEGGFKNSKEAKNFYTEVMQLIGEFSAEEIASRSRKIDAQPPELKNGEVVISPPMKELLEQLRDLEVYGLALPRELGGLNCPLTVYHTLTEVIGRGDVSVLTQYSFYGGIALALFIYSVWEETTEFQGNPPVVKKTRFRKALTELMAGAEWGSMDITEPDCGSDMAQIRTKAHLDEQGMWRVNGEKIYITAGHGKYHIVIARSESAAENPELEGLAGLSLFLVEAFEEVDGKRQRHVTINTLEKKMGHHGSVTVAVSFNNAPAHLIGKRGEGFKMMLLLMNNARIGVGFEALGIGEDAYRKAKDYAEQRPSMGKPIAQHEMIAEYLDWMDTEIKAMRAIAMTSAFNEELYQRLNMKSMSGYLSEAELELNDKRMRRYRSRSRHLTPLLKYYNSETVVEICRMALQIHGGNGYSREYDVERLMRESLVMPIYEGTSQIQSLMVTKDALQQVLKDPAKFAQQTAITKTQSVTSRSPLKRRVISIQVLVNSALRFLVTRIGTGKFRQVRGRPMTEWAGAMLGEWDPRQDFAPALLHAERLTKLMAISEIAGILLDQSERHQEREQLLERYLNYNECKAQYLYNQITHSGAHILAALRGEDKKSGQEASQESNASATMKNPADHAAASSSHA